MKIILFSRPKVVMRPEDIRAIFDSIATYSFDYMINSEAVEQVKNLADIDIPQSKIYSGDLTQIDSSDILVCYGGDGTILEGLHRLTQTDAKVVGINGGHLGFLALAPRSDIRRVFASIADDSLQFQTRHLIEVSGILGGKEQKLYALNEVAVQRLGATMISVETSIDNQEVFTCKGDGMIVATPTGSTAYSLSAGGPIVSPLCRCIILSPLSSHNLTMRPLVVGDNKRIDLVVRSRGNRASVSVDNRTFEIEDGTALTICCAERVVKLAVPCNISFFDTLKDKMLWSVDRR